MSTSPFSFHPAAADCPLLVTVCHAGRGYTPALLGMARVPRPVLAQLEDPLVDELAGGVRALGAGLIVARAPRAAVDLNRAPDDVDPAAVRGGIWRPTARARMGLGVLPSRLSGVGGLWRAPLPAAELERRIDEIHAPFHEQVERELGRALASCGAAVLLDLHSMPPLPEGTQVVLGDRHGSSCAPSLVEAAAGAADRQGLSWALNAPYAGGYVAARHGQPSSGVHALQIELSRDLYLDGAGRRASGWDAAEAFVIALAQALVDEVTPAAWRQAAE